MKWSDMLTLTPYELKEIADQNKARLEMGLTAIVVKERTCLQCSTQFQSSGLRRCKPCHKLLQGKGYSCLSGYDVTETAVPKFANVGGLRSGMGTESGIPHTFLPFDENHTGAHCWGNK